MGQIHLKRLNTTAGFLQQAPIEFSPKLTCIIGARGTCKSTLIESLRFCLDHDPQHAQTLRGSKAGDATQAGFGLMRATLGAGTVQVAVNESLPHDLMLYSVERDIDSESRVYVEDVREYTDHGFLKGFEIYSQGDLQRIADGQGDRLSLIDRPNAAQVTQLRETRGRIGHSLREIGEKLRILRLQIVKLEASSQDLPNLIAQLQGLQQSRPSLSEELEASRSAHLRRNDIISGAVDALAVQRETTAYLRDIPKYMGTLEHFATDLETFGLDDTEPAVMVLRQSTERLSRMIALTAELLQLDLEPTIGAMREDFAAKDEVYFDLQRKQNELLEQLKREDHLQRQIALMKRSRADLEKLRQQERALLNERQHQRSELEAINGTLYDLRLAQIDAINEEHGNLVLLRLQPGSQSDAYIELLAELLEGSRIRDRRQVAEELAKRVSPAELIDFVEVGDAQELASVAERDYGQMTRVISFLSDHERLYDLEGKVQEDRLDITFHDNGVSKPIEWLSKGQKATALLPLILRPSSHPLIIDQPEDDLDNNFIYQSLVQAIQSLKQERQLIFVTHNANIPVLGEAEQVVVMRMEDPELAQPPSVGTVDERKQDILNLLEGGAEAFEERHRRYEGLL